MSVLARDIDAYNRALEVYQRRAGSYNSGVGKYNESFVRDPSGNPYVYSGEYDPAGANTGQFYTADKVSGQLTDAEAPAEYAGMTANPDSPPYSMVRKNPIGKETKTFTGATKGGGGTDRYGKPIPEYFYVPGERDPAKPIGQPEARQLDASKVRVVAVTEGARSGMGASIPTYTIEYDVNSFIDKPGEFTETFDKKAPDPTKAQLDRAGQPSLAQQEMGLIGEVLRSKGLKTGLKGIVRKKLDEKPVSATEEPT